MPSLLTLPKELQLQIAEYLGLETDQKNLCLVSKEMRNVATPMLYKDMVLHVDKLNSAFRRVIETTENHSGLPHIRTLRVVSKNSGDFVSSRRYRILRQLISGIPRDVLTRFELPAFSLLDEDLSDLLRLQQRHLTNYQYHSPARNKNDDTLLLPNNDELSHVTTLQLCIQYEDDCKAAAVVLDRAPRITSLAVNLSDPKLEKGSHVSSYTSREMGRVIIESIFSPTHGHRGQRELITLRLEEICLADAGGLLQRFVKLGTLQHLQLLRCEDVDPLLAVLTHKCADLESFALEDYPYQHDSAVNNFVEATSPRRLVLKLKPEPDRPAYIGAQGLVAFDTLSTFAHTIQCLVLEDNNPNHHAYSPHRQGGSSLDFLGLCESLQSLQQLSVGCPTIEKRYWTDCGFLDFVQALRCLHKLRVLKLVLGSWQRYDPKCQLYQEAADKVFEIMGPSCPQLIAVVFELRVYRGCLTWSFVRSKRCGHPAQAKLLGEDVAPYVIKDYEPCSDILETEKPIFG